MLLLGAHLSIAGGLHNALLLTEQLGCNCVQLFLRNQRQWSGSGLDEKAIALWNETRKKLAARIHHVVGHSGYLINLASDSERIRRLSLLALKEELSRCETLDIPALVLHPGSHRGQGTKTGIKLLTEGLAEALSQTRHVRVLLEFAAGAGNCLGGSVEEIAEIIGTSSCPVRLGCCLDTCHLFANGFDLSTPDGLNLLVEKIDRLLGPQKIGCIHLNDSKGEKGSRLDRHEHIGKGCIRKETFRVILNSKKLESVPKIIETPKGVGQGLKFDRQNLACLRKMIL